MSEKKNIDRLFQEQFKDFEAAPPEYVWENIYEALQEKKKRRVIPLWIRLSGVAAVLLIGLAISWPFFNGVGIQHDPAVVIEHQANPSLKNEKNNPGNAVPKGPGIDNGITPPGQDKGVIVDAGTDKNTDIDDASTQREIAPGAVNGGRGSKVKNNNLISTDNAVADGENQSGSRASNKNKRSKNIRNNNDLTNGGIENTVAGTNTAHRNRRNGKGEATGNRTQSAGQRNAAPGISGGNEDAVAGVNTSNKNNRNGNAIDTNGAGQNKGTVNAGTGQDKNTAVAQNSATDKNKQGAGNETPDGLNAGIPVIDKTLPVEQVVAEAAVDTVKPVTENALDKLLREQQEGKKEEQVAEADGPKWNIKPQLAPVFYNSLSQGSPIDSQFAANAKSFNNDLSLGVGVDYAVSSRLKIRSGVNTVNLNYATQNVEFYASLSGSTNNVSPNARSANIVVQDKTEGQGTNSAFASNAKDAYAGSMVQRTGYLEVPVEMSYALLNKRFGIELIGGVSTLFLNQNNVSVVSTQGLSTSVGEAENLNNIHFSTNVGVGFRYRFFKSFEANFEPMFKYQVNTFSRDAGNFKPYFIGLYSGISFSF